MFNQYLDLHKERYFNIEDLVFGALRMKNLRLARDLAPYVVSIMHDEMEFCTGWKKDEIELRIEDVETVREQLRLSMN